MYLHFMWCTIQYTVPVVEEGPLIPLGYVVQVQYVEYVGHDDPTAGRGHRVHRQVAVGQAHLLGEIVELVYSIVHTYIQYIL